MGYGSYWFSLPLLPPQILPPNDIFLQIHVKVGHPDLLPHISALRKSKKDKDKKGKPTLRPGDGKKPPPLSISCGGPWPFHLGPFPLPFLLAISLPFLPLSTPRWDSDHLPYLRLLLLLL